MTLVVFGGLPGTGKTSLARAVADAIEVAIQNFGVDAGDSPVAYSVANAVAADVLCKCPRFPAGDRLADLKPNTGGENRVRGRG